MSSEIAIKVENISKAYQIYSQPRDRLKQFILPNLQRFLGKPTLRYYSEFWALRDISFEIPKGQITGVLGKNGAGKSTLLQILCGTLAPLSGQVSINGKIAALLELGAGFNPEFSGLDNVYMNAQILGLDKTFIDSVLEEIKSFADIGDFFYQPVKTYSSGMFARLAFSVAVHVEPEILIIDEALSVGDSWFQHKSMAKMKSMMSRGCTVIFVSHSIESVRALCQKAIWIDHGTIKLYGDATTVTNQYMNEVFIEHNRITLETVRAEPPASTLLEQGVLAQTKVMTDVIDPAKSLDGGSAIDVCHISIKNSENIETTKLNQGEHFSLTVIIKFLQKINNISVGFIIKDQFGQELTGESIFNKYRHSMNFEAGQSMSFKFSSKMQLRGGQSYSVALRVNQVSKWDRSDNVLIYANDIAAVFDVISDPDNPMWFKFRQHFDAEVLHD